MKLVTFRPIAALGLALVLGSCAADTPNVALMGEGAQCFRPDDVVAFKQLTQTSFVIRTQRGKVFSADLPACRGIDWAQQVALSPIRSRQICEGDQGRLLTRDPGGRDMTCNAFSFHELSAAEVLTLPAQARP